MDTGRKRSRSIVSVRLRQGLWLTSRTKVQQGNIVELTVSMGGIRREDRKHTTVRPREVAGNPGLQFESVSNGVIHPSLLKGAGILAYDGY